MEQDNEPYKGQYDNIENIVEIMAKLEMDKPLAVFLDHYGKDETDKYRILLALAYAYYCGRCDIIDQYFTIAEVH